MIFVGCVLLLSTLQPVLAEPAPCISLNWDPVDGDTIELYDVLYEFDNNGQVLNRGAVPVAVGQTRLESAANLAQVLPEGWGVRC